VSALSFPRRALAALAAGLLVLAPAAPTRASGFYVTDRGVRSLGRGGAFVAGADDQHAMWYNPAGLAFAGRGVLFDSSLILFHNRFQRTAQVTPTSPVVDFEPVEASGIPLPLPTLVVSHDFNQRNWNFAAGLFAPNAVITSWSDAPLAPQRYSIISIEGSALALMGAWAAYRPSNELSFGFGVQALMGSFVARMAMSACPATITCQPEDPDWDSIAQMRVGPIFAPTASAGVRWQPNQYVVFGLSGQLPMWVDAPAQMQVRLPSHPFYDGAQVDGDRANVSFTLAPVLRAGVEFRPTSVDHVEVTGVFEGWAIHDRLLMTPVRDESQPNGIRITNARGIGTYEVGPTAVERGFRHAFSLRVGAERFQDLGHGWTLIPRAGLAYETSATAPEYTSVLTFDTDKVLATMGVGVSYGRWRFDAVYAHMFASSVEVAPADARLHQVQPFRSNGQAPAHAINAGHYDLNVDVLGAGMRYQFQ
jgi:long-chain fatty acid transport protein